MPKIKGNTFRPLGTNITFRRIYPPKPKDAVIASVNYEDVPLECEIVAIGGDVTLVDTGDRVLIPRNCGQLVKDHGVFLGREGEVLAKLS